MSDTGKLIAVGVAAWLLLGQCQQDPVSAAKVAGTGAAVGVGVGAGIAGTAALKGATQGLSDRARDRVRARPNGPARPLTSTTLPPAVVGPMAVAT